MRTTLNFLMFIALVLMGTVAMGPVTAKASGSGPPITGDDPPPRGPSVPVEHPDGTP